MTALSTLGRARIRHVSDACVAGGTAAPAVVGEQNLLAPKCLLGVITSSRKQSRPKRRRKKPWQEAGRPGSARSFLKDSRWRACPGTQHHQRWLRGTQGPRDLRPLLSHCLCRPSQHLFTKHLLFHLHVNCLRPLRSLKAAPSTSSCL